MCPFSNRGKIKPNCSEGGHCNFRSFDYSSRSGATFTKCTKCGEVRYRYTQTQAKALPDFYQKVSADLAEIKSAGVK